MTLSVLYGFRELRVVLGTCILRAAAVCSVHGSLSPLQCSMPIVQIASTALHDANDALLGVHCITRITRPHFHCFSDLRFGALSPTKLRVHPLKFSSLLRPHPLTHFVRSKSSSLAYRLAFVISQYIIYIYIHHYFNRRILDLLDLARKRYMPLLIVDHLSLESQQKQLQASGRNSTTCFPFSASTTTCKYNDLQYQ